MAVKENVAKAPVPGGKQEKQIVGKDKDASIIKIIRDMVGKGESEEMIVKTLQELGVDPKAAKRLLLLGQADTFALLSSEISKIVKKDIEKEKPKLVAFIKAEAKKAEDDMTKKVEKRALNAFKEDQAFIENQATMFQSRVNQGVKNITQLNSETREHLGDLGTRLANAERDVWALKHRVFGSKVTRGMSLLLLGLQAGLVIASAYLFFTAFEGIAEEMLILGMIIGSVIAAIVYLIAFSR